MSGSVPQESPHVRAYRDGDEGELVTLFARVFGSAITGEHWRWKLRHPAIAVDNVWLAVDGERPVFQYAGTPLRFSIDGAPVTAVVSVDTMTAPEFRRRGLLTRVATQAYARWREQGVSFVIGLPNQQWGSRTAALGWQELFGLQWLAMPLRPHDFAARRFKLPVLRRFGFVGAGWNYWLRRRHAPDPGLTIEDVQVADSGFDLLWERCRGTAHFSNVRDGAWIQWRFLRSPTRRYTVLRAVRGGLVAGYAAFRIDTAPGKVTAALAELIVAPDEPTAASALLHALLVRLRAARAETLVTLAAPGSALHRWLRGAGFFRGPGFSVQLVPLDDRLPLARMRDPAQWQITGADFDVI